jgi:hypothetical protein
VIIRSGPDPLSGRFILDNRFYQFQIVPPDLGPVHIPLKGAGEPLHWNPLDLVEGNLVAGAIIEFGGAQAFVRTQNAAGANCDAARPTIRSNDQKGCR